MEWLYISFLTFTLHRILVSGQNCMTYEKADVKSKCDALNYLNRYDYTTYTVEELDSSNETEKLQEALEVFQKIGRLPVTGTLDETTYAKMNEPRCGMADTNLSIKYKKRTKRFTKHGTMWDKTEITYRITRYTPDLATTTVDRVVRKAFDQWASVTPLSFDALPNGQPDIVIFFNTDFHGDNRDFDGPGGSLAHAFFPPISGDIGGLTGDIHLDDGENWTDQSADGVNLYYMVLHEIGHSLGLDHSDIEGATMEPFIPAYDKAILYPKLHEDDITGIQAIYGKPSNVSPAPLPSPPSVIPESTKASKQGNEEALSSNSPVCFGEIDALSVAYNGNLLAYKGPTIYEIDIKSGEKGEIKSEKFITEMYPDGPSTVDSALNYKGSWYNKFMSGTYLFKGDTCWRYVFTRGNFMLLEGFPKTIKEEFNIDLKGGKIWAGYANSVMYILGDNEYWMHNGFDLIQGSPYPLMSHPIYKDFPLGIQAITLIENWNTGLIVSDNDLYKFKYEPHGGVTVDLKGPGNAMIFGCEFL